MKFDIEGGSLKIEIPLDDLAELSENLFKTYDEDYRCTVADKVLWAQYVIDALKGENYDFDDFEKYLEDAINDTFDALNRDNNLQPALKPPDPPKPTQQCGLSIRQPPRYTKCTKPFGHTGRCK